MGEASVAELRFSVSRDAGAVSAILVRPPSPLALLVFGHGAGAGMRHRFMEGMCEALSHHRIATLRYQFPYAEAGRRRPDRAQTLTATVRAAVAAAREVEPDLALIAGGKSMGGRMTSTAQAERSLPGVRGLVFFGFPLHRPGDPSDARGNHLREVDLPMLFVQGTRDRLAESDRIAAVVAALKGGASIHVVEDADHGFDVPKRAGRSPEDVYDEMAVAVRGWSEAILA
jgi:uncharacterized protein